MGARPKDTQARRIAMSVARYLLRMSGRATPFGLAAGVAAARFGPEPSARWTARPHTVIVRSDVVWLAGVIATLEACPELLRRLPMMTNDLAVVRGDRLVVLVPPHAADPDRSVSAEVSVRRSRAVELVVDAARSPIRGGDLIDKLFAEFTASPVQVIETTVAELVKLGVLITALRPPSTCHDGLAHVLDRLTHVDAATLDRVAPLVERLRTIHAELAATTSAAWTSARSRPPVAAHMRDICDRAEQPVMVDLRLGSSVELPPQVAAEAEAAADVLLRLTPDSGGTSAWRDYHARFLNRYGAAALVPVTDLVDPTIGLGFPAGYCSGRPSTPCGLSERDKGLLALAQQAALDGAREVVLDDLTIDVPAPTPAADADRPPHLEVCADVRAATTTALVEGAFTLGITGIGRTAAAMSGRFLNVLLAEDHEPLARLYRRLPVSVDGADPALLSFPPRHPHTENVARSPLALPVVISLAEHRDDSPGRIRLDDLAVTADTDRLYLVSLSRRRVVEPMIAHAIALDAMPPLARFLFEIPRARASVVTLWRWGAAAELPFLPRVRYGRNVLSPARWRIPIRNLPGPDASQATWTAAMTRLRDRLDLPATVHAGTADRLLRLDLNEPMDLAVLRAHANTCGDYLVLAEAPSALDHGWCGGRVHEVLIPLVSTAQPAGPPRALARPGRLPLVDRDHGRMPGSNVLYARLYGHPDLHETVLTRHLPALFTDWEPEPLWWFIRYRDPDPHLRLRIHLPIAAAFGDAASRVGAWAADLRQLGLIGDLTLNTDHPEVGRYGMGPALAAAETVFAADSTAALTQMAARPNSGVHPVAITAASLVDMASAMNGGVANGMRWLIDHPQLGQPSVPGNRAIYAQAVTLADPSQDHAALHAIPGGPQIAAMWQERRTALAAYAESLHDPGQAVTVSSALGSLLHLHVVRAHGIDPQLERWCHRLARAAALAWTAHHPAGETE
ncbi:lantibiotic dehydratase [Actinoallomurus purpureus]|nr:lantibiotic dehydratase [Actinoallomurus purpureus]